MFEELRKQGFEIEMHSHAAAILQIDFPDAVEELTLVLAAVQVPIGELVGSGGGETRGTQRLRRALAERGWRKVSFEISKAINGVPRQSTSHEVDHVREFENNKLVALEIEWNNKDPFFDRDLENFKRLHAEGAISIGVIVTRGASLQDQLPDLITRFARERKISTFDDLQGLGLNPTTRQRREIGRSVERTKGSGDFGTSWASRFVQDKYGAATTHWRKLQDRIHRGVGNPCPLLLVGLPASIVTFES